MRYLLFFIIIFLLIRWISHAYFNRPSMRGKQRGGQRMNQGRSSGSRDSGRFSQVEDADFEILEDEDEQKQNHSSNRDH